MEQVADDQKHLPSMQLSSMQLSSNTTFIVHADTQHSAHRAFQRGG